MKLDCILTAVNEKPFYLDFIPFFIKTWNKLYPDVDVKIILVAKQIPEEYLQYKDNIILFEPIINVSTSFISQFIRLLYPCILNYKNGIMITDIDMIPMNRTYYTEHIKSFDDSNFIYLRGNTCFNSKQIAMCYNVALPNVWKEIFEINSVEDMVNTIKNVIKNNGGEEWYLDQIILYQKVMNWNSKTQKLVCISDDETRFNRFHRGSITKTGVLDDVIKNNISNGVYSDYHCARPMGVYSKLNYDIYNLL